MADIFHEIDEDLRRERFSRIWSRYGIYIIGFAVLIVVTVGAWRGYEYWKLKQEQASGAKFESGLELGTEGKNAEAEAAFAALEKDGTNGYRILSRFRSAVELSKTDRAAAIKDYDALALDSGIGHLMRDVAKVRAALLLVDTAPLADIQARMNPLNTPDGAFRHSAREIIGLSQYKAGNFKDAVTTFDAIMNDSQTPPGLRRRAELMRALASGSIPAPAAAAAPAVAPAEAAPAAAAPEPAPMMAPADAPTAPAEMPAPMAPVEAPAAPAAEAPAVAPAPAEATPAPAEAAPAAPAPAEPTPAPAAPAAP